MPSFQPGGRVFAATYASTVLGDSPVSYWRLGETSGTSAYDSGTGGNNGAYSGGHTLGVAGAIANDTNTAVKVNGSTGYVNVRDKANLDITGDMSIELWAKPGALNGTPQTVLQKGANVSSSSGWQYRIIVNSSNHWQGGIFVGTSMYEIADNLDTLSTARWYHLVLVRSGSTLTFYVNGQSVGSISISGATNSTTGALAFGRAGSYSKFYFNGSVDEVAMYNTALSLTQIQNHFTFAVTYASTVLGDSPVSYWRLGETSGTSAYDSGTGGNNGAYSGGYTLGVAGAIANDTNTAVQFDGSTGYVNVPDKANLDITGDMSIELWAKPGALNGTPQTVLQKGANVSSSSGWQYRMSITSTNRWKASIYVGGTSYDVTDTLDILSTARWDYLVLVRSGTTLVVYVNGQNVGGVSISGATNSTTGALAFGRAGSYSNYYLNASVDEVAIYNYGLSLTQIQNHYLAGGGVLPAPSPPTTSSDPVVMGAGDIACDPTDRAFNGGNGTSTECQQKWTAAELGGVKVVIPLGDEQYNCGTLTQFQQSYALSWGKQKSITDPAVGNHEYVTTCSNAAGAGGYYTYFGAKASPLDTNCTSNCRGYYSYNLGSWHIIVLNSECDQVGGCQAGSAQEQWLQADLAANLRACTLAYWHRPYYTSGWSLGDSAMHDIWVDLYNAHVDLVLNGHDHDYERFLPQDANGNYDPAQGIVEIIAGTGGANHGGFNGVAANSVVRDGTTFGVLKLTLHAASYNWQFVGDGQSGGFTDLGSASCH